MMRKMLRVAIVGGIFVMVGGLGTAALLRAAVPGRDAPPQVITRGFESPDDLLRDVDRAERGPMYSAWIVESSRFMNVPFGSFMPDKASLNTTVNLPVNVGIIKDPKGPITLYDSGWEQLSYI